MILTVKALLIIALSVVGWGLVLSMLFGRREEPYLLTVTGKRSNLLMVRVGIWATAIMLGIALWFTLSWVLPSIVALALFFGFEAGALDICGQRIRFVPTSKPQPVPVAVYRETAHG